MIYVCLSFCVVTNICLLVKGQSRGELKGFTKTIEEMALDYEDDKNSMIAMAEKDDEHLYDDFYDELDNRVRIEQSLNMIFFGPPSSFMRLDAETILHILTHTKKHLIPTMRALLAWDIITDGKTAAFLQGRELLAFGALLNVVPEEDLYYVNFGDPSVLKHFSNAYLCLDRRKYGILAAAYRRYYGNAWYYNSTYINELGYVLCGFPPYDIELIPPQIFKEISTDILNKLDKCDNNQTKTLYNIATHPDAYGAPYKWTSHEVNKLGSLFTSIPPTEISSVQLEAVTGISSEVMKKINQDKLTFFTKQQILRMNKKARRVYLLRLQLKNSLDMSRLAKHALATRLQTVLTTINIVVLVFLYVFVR